MAALKHRLFFTLYPDPETAARLSGLIDRLRRRHGLTGPRVAQSRLHISLNFLGEDPSAAIVDRTSEAVSMLVMRPFVVSLDHVMSFKGGELRPLVLTSDDGVIGVMNLHTAIYAALADAGLAPLREPIRTPHLTLLRDRRAPPEEFIDPVSWWVREFVLVDSPYGEGRHDVLGRWPLTG